MFAFFAAFLFTALPRPAPLPDAKGIDSVTYAIGTQTFFGGRGSLTINRSGKVAYDHWSAPQTGSGGKHTKTDWVITEEDAADVFARLVAVGLLKLPTHLGIRNNGIVDVWAKAESAEFTVSSGRWRSHYFAHPIPEKIIAVLRPLLEKAHPDLWKVTPNAIPAKAEPRALTAFLYSYHDLQAGHLVTLHLSRQGVPYYFRQDRTLGITAPILKKGDWELEGKDASAKLLDALYAAGIADLKEELSGPIQHRVVLCTSDWRLTINPKELPEPIRKILQPLLDKAALPAPKK